MSCIAIIPARGGSKRIPRKNIRNFHGKPIIEHTILRTIETGIFQSVFVSTDDLEIAKIASRTGAEILHRNADLANDFATTVEVMANAVAELESVNTDKIESVCCIYPVNPNLNGERILQAQNLLAENELDYVFTAKRYESSPARALRIGQSGLSEMYFPAFSNSRSQDLPEYFHDAAMFYLGNLVAWREKKPILNGNSKFIILGKYETLDIDDEEDWAMMERLHLAPDSLEEFGTANG